MTPQKGYTKACDMWSVGVVATLLLTGERPFSWDDSKNLPLIDGQYEQRPDWQGLRGHPKDFVNKLLVLNEAIRLTADQALHHEWFTNDSHRNAYRKVYEKAISGWQRSVLRATPFEIITGRSLEPVSGSINL